MNRLVKKCALTLFASTLLAVCPGFAATIVWDGPGSDLNDGNNWAGGVTPGVGDIAEFQSNAPFNPTVITPNLFEVSQINFTGASYTLESNAFNSFTPSILSVVGTGVTNPGNAPQTFSIVQRGRMQFSNNANAGNDTISYDIAGPFNILSFSNNSSAGDANITSFHLPSFTPPIVVFNDNATAATSKIHGSGTAVIFFTNSTAASSTLTMDQSSDVDFGGASFVDDAVISLDFARFTFNSTSATSTAEITMSNFSQANINQNFALERITSDSVSAIVIATNTSLTINNPTSGDTLAGPIIGGALIKQGTSDLTISNTNNAYDALEVGNGTLKATTQSLSPVAVSTLIDSTGVLQLQDSFSGNYSPSITNNGKILYTGTASSTLSGILSGTGTLDVNAPNGVLLINNTSNSYNGGTHVIAGKLQTLATSLPQALIEPSATIDSGATLEFIDNSAATFAGNILDNGTVLYTGPATVTLSGTISGAGGVTVNGDPVLFPSTLILSNIYNSYTGGTSIINGIVEASPATLPVGVQFYAVTASNNSALKFSLGSGTFAGKVLLNNASTLNVISPNTITMSDLIAGTGSVVVDSGAELIFTGVAKVYSGGSAVGGILRTEGQLLPVGGAVNTLNPNAQLIFTTTGTNSFSGPITGQGQVLMNGPGVQGLTGANTYSGGTYVNSGRLVVNSSSLPVSLLPISATVNNGAILEFDQIVAGTYAGNIALNGPLTKLSATGAGQLTLIGNITGTGALELQGAHVILTGAGNNYSGGTTIPVDSILEGSAGPLQGAIVNDGQLVFNQATNGVFTGSITSTTTSAIITKRGNANLYFISPNTGFQGTTNIEQGGLVLNTLLGGSVNIFQNGFLDGNGAILGNVVNSGHIRPGNSIGTLTVGGDFQQTFSGTYVAEVDGIGNSDLINVGGTASLGGALVVITLDGVIDPTQTYTILHAAGGVQGIFSTVLSTNPMAVVTVTYLPNDVILGLESVLVNIAANHNQREVAQQLLNLTHPTADEQVVIAVLSALASNPETVKQAQKALSQMSGEVYTNALWVSEATNRQFLRRMYDPLRTIMTAHLNSGCCDGCPYATWTPSYWEPCNISGWFEVGGGHAFAEHDRNAGGLNLNTVEIAAGLQTTVNDNFTWGVAGEYAHDRIHYNVGGSALNTSGLAGLYALYRPQCWYLLGNLVFNYNHSKVTRIVDIGTIHLTAHGKPKSMQETLYVEGGFDLNYQCFLLQPFLGIEVDFFRTNKFCESGSSPMKLSVKKKYHTNAYSRLGVHFSATTGCWTAAFDVAWQCRLTAFQNSLNVRFQDFGNTFPILGVRVPRNSLDAAANITASLSSGWEFFAEVACQRWAHASTYLALGGFKYSF